MNYETVEYRERNNSQADNKADLNNIIISEHYIFENFHFPYKIMPDRINLSGDNNAPKSKSCLLK